MTVQELNAKIPANTAAGAPTRLTMVARKDFRDRFENEKSNHEKFFADLFGGDWSIKLDPAGLFTYMDQKDEGMFGFYCNKFFDQGQTKDNLRAFVTNYGEDGKKDINVLAYNHVITIEPGAEEGLDFQHGKFRIVFVADHFTRAASYWSQQLAETVAKAKTARTDQAPEMSIIAKKDIRDRYEAEIQTSLDRARKYLQNPQLEFVPNFEDNYRFYEAWEEELRSNADDRVLRDLEKNWQGMIGYFTLKYFAQFTDWLQNNGFANDDMLQEGFKAAVSQNRIALRQVEDTVPIGYSNGYTGDAVIEDGVLVLRTTRKGFGWNEGNCLRNIMDLL